MKQISRLRTSAASGLLLSSASDLRRRRLGTDHCVLNRRVDENRIAALLGRRSRSLAGRLCSRAIVLHKVETAALCGRRVIVSRPLRCIRCRRIRKRLACSRQTKSQTAGFGASQVSYARTKRHPRILCCRDARLCNK